MKKPEEKDRNLYGVIDIGGTKIYAAVMNGQGAIRGADRKRTRAERGFKAVMERAAKCLEEACEDAGVALRTLRAVGVGAPGPVLADGTVVNAPNVKWHKAPVAKALSLRLKRPVFVENDCNAATLGEYALGAGRGAEILVGFYVGTGLGGGIVYKGDVVRGANRQAAELGHMIVEKDGRLCGCGHRGCLEAYASKTGMAAFFTEAIDKKRRRSSLPALCKGRQYATIKATALGQAYRKKDAVAVEGVNRAAEYLGLGIANLITTIGPDRVVLGGGVIEALGRGLLPRIRQAARAATHPPTSFRDTKIVLSALGDNAVVTGAMIYARERMAEKKKRPKK
ncbi:MAG: ROK family protein [Planctomycetota bacterium]